MVVTSTTAARKSGVGGGSRMLFTIVVAVAAILFGTIAFHSSRKQQQSIDVVRSSLRTSLVPMGVHRLEAVLRCASAALLLLFVCVVCPCCRISLAFFR